MTARGTVHNAVEAMQAGAYDYILKPFDFEILEKTVRRAIGPSAGKPGGQFAENKLYNRQNGKEIITRNPKLGGILKQARGIAPSNATVLIQGESGTGKELLAAYVHRHSLHPEAPYVAINCAALPENLLEQGRETSVGQLSQARQEDHPPRRYFGPLGGKLPEVDVPR